jgi:ABC-2 type transport system ATP-binding protein
LPDLLILDEPTNGLDPPQIIEMRQVLRDYAATGRTILVSSHLLSEVQQTCTEVVVMNHGVVLAQASVDDLVRGRQGMSLEDVFMEIVGYGHEVVTE